MNEQTAEVLKHIANKLDVPVEQLWAGMVAYAPFWFYKYVACVALGILIGAAFLYASRQFYLSGIGEYVPSIFAGISGVITLAITGIFGASMLSVMRWPRDSHRKHGRR